MNTRLPWGAPLPHANIPDVDAATRRGTRPVVSDLFIGAVAGIPPFAVRLPIARPRNDEVSDVLCLSLPVARIRKALLA